MHNGLQRANAYKPLICLVAWGGIERSPQPAPNLQIHQVLGAPTAFATAVAPGTTRSTLPKASRARTVAAHLNAHNFTEDED
jgi:hypothetical protein